MKKSIIIAVFAILLNTIFSSCKNSNDTADKTIYIYDYEELFANSTPMMNVSKGEYGDILIYTEIMQTNSQHGDDEEDTAKLMRLSLGAGILEDINVNDPEKYFGHCHSTDDGNVHIVKSVYNSNQASFYMIYKYSEDMEYLSEIKLSLKDENIFFTSLSVYKDYFILSAFGVGLKIFDDMGNLINEIEIGTPNMNCSNQYYIHDGKIHIMSLGNDHNYNFIVYDIDARKFVSEKK